MGNINVIRFLILALLLSVFPHEGVLGLHVLCRRRPEQMPADEVLSPNQMRPARQAIRSMLVNADILRLQQL
ncbi:hypothetical protein BHM03_00048071 [Ensete ventricosum]|nr:hypothetical protein BHM03_00048071 [Ensete ventricosum]